MLEINKTGKLVLENDNRVTETLNKRRECGSALAPQSASASGYLHGADPLFSLRPPCAVSIPVAAFEPSPPPSASRTSPRSILSPVPYCPPTRSSQVAQPSSTKRRPHHQPGQLASEGFPHLLLSGLLCPPRPSDSGGQGSRPVGEEEPERLEGPRRCKTELPPPRALSQEC